MERYIGVLSLIISFSVMELIVSILVGSKVGNSHDTSYICFSDNATLLQFVP